jgi:ATP-binding cassette subfamily B protein
MNRATVNVSGEAVSLVDNTGGFIQSMITLLAIGVLLLSYGIGLPILLLISTLPAFYVVLRLNRRTHLWWERTTTARRWLQYYELLMTHPSAVGELRLFDLGNYFHTAYQQLRCRLRREKIQLARERSIGRLGVGIISLILSGSVLLWIGRQVLLGAMTLGDLALFYQAFYKGQELVRSVLDNLGQIYNNSLFLKNLFDFLQLQPQLVEPCTPKIVPILLKQGIKFRHLSFRYPGSDRYVLQDFNLSIPAGKMVAIVGDNGAGKSTLFKLICRFYDPEAGSIELDGVNLRELSTASLRRSITALFQEPVPYYVTAAQNIVLGDLSSSPQKEEIEIAARRAGIHDAIKRLPQGYDSLMGKGFAGGNEFSGGEWQRLALARAFLRRAAIILLDEPTSAMDPWAEIDWLDCFRHLAQGRTAIVITHRFTLAMRADIIYVIM